MTRRFEYTPVPAGVSLALSAAAGVLHRWSVQDNPASPLGLFDASREARPALDERELVIPTDLLLAAWRGLFPAERMMLICGRQTAEGATASSVRDVTGPAASVAHVTASTDALCRVLLDFDLAGGRLVGWIHSHPGAGARSTLPSCIDRDQDEDLRRDFGDRLVGLIVTHDGYLRAWGAALDEGNVQLRFHGRAIEPLVGEQHVYRLAI